jgi:hypothetical protein
VIPRRCGLHQPFVRTWLFNNKDAKEKDEDDKGNGGGLPDLSIINPNRDPAIELREDEAM